MAKHTELAVSPREITGKATKSLRKVGIIPANIFGRGEESQAVQVEAHAFDTLHRNHHTTGMITLKTSGTMGSQTALVRRVQRHPISGKILHIDFLRVHMRDRITSKVPLHFEGVAPGVKIEGGVLLHQLDALEVECAASDLVEFFEVDVSSLEHIEDTLHAKDVKLPEHFVLITDAEEAIVKVNAPRVEAVEESAVSEEATPASAPTAENGEA